MKQNHGLKLALRSRWRLVALAAGLSLALACTSTDMRITTKVKSTFAADSVVKASQIDVKTRNGVVTLTGNVDGTAAKARALQLAKDTKGVVSVVDMLSSRTAAGSGDAPEPQRTVGETIDDAGITLRVKNTLLDDPQIHGLRIDVDTRDGVVFLTGAVGSDAQRLKAIQLAKDSKGVRDVQSNLTIKS